MYGMHVPPHSMVRCQVLRFFSHFFLSFSLSLTMSVSYSCSCCVSVFYLRKTECTHSKISPVSHVPMTHIKPLEKRKKRKSNKIWLFLSVSCTQWWPFTQKNGQLSKTIWKNSFYVLYRFESRAKVEAFDVIASSSRSSNKSYTTRNLINQQLLDISFVRISTAHYT